MIDRFPRSSGPALRIVVITGEGEHSDPWHALLETGARVARVLADEFTKIPGRAAEVRMATTSDDLTEAMNDADVVVMNVSGDLAEPPSDSSALVDAILAHSAAQRGIVALHSSTLAFRDDPRWAELLGGRWVPGVTMHPQIGHALVQATGNKDCLPADDFVLYDERYTALETDERVEVLAFHTEDGLTHPLVWRAEAEESHGRVAYDALGHGVESFDSLEHRALITALVEWAGVHPETERFQGKPGSTV